MKHDIAVRPDILSVKVWRPDGVLAWTIEPERIGKRFPLEGGHLEEALETGEAEAELEDLNAEEDSAGAKLGIDHVLEVYAPILDSGARSSAPTRSTRTRPGSRARSPRGSG